MTDKQIQENVLHELDWEPQVKSTDIGVAVKDGIVTFSGFVDSYNQRHHAEQAAKRVLGVRAVANDLEVKLPKDGERSDPDIARDAAALLEAHTEVPGERIKITVHAGWVTLEGQVDWRYQSEAAEAAVSHLRGVQGVRNLIIMRAQPPVSPTQVKAKIEEALRRTAELDARRITVETSNSTVILHGRVHSWFERQEAEAATWRSAGVTKVENHLVVVP
jgi:osmotically-inducible protein OsmY